MLNCGKDVFYCDSEDDNIIDPEYFVASETFKIVDEAKKDLFEPMIILEAIDKPHVNDYACTYQKLQDRLIKWFGDLT